MSRELCSLDGGTTVYRTLVAVVVCRQIIIIYIMYRLIELSEDPHTYII